MKVVKLLSALGLTSAVQMTDQPKEAKALSKSTNEKPVLVPSKKVLEPVLDGKGGLRFDHSAKELDKLTEDFIAHARQVRDEILNIDSPTVARTFKNTMLPFAQMESDSTTFNMVLSFYGSVASDKELREASEAISKKFEDWNTELYSSKKLY